MEEFMGINLELNTGSYKVIYVYTIDDGLHDGRVKVGDATYHTSLTLSEILEKNTSSDSDFITSPEIEASAHKRIKEQTGTADIKYNLLFAALAVKPILSEDSSEILKYESFRDYDLHSILKRSGFEKEFNRSDKKVGEWFRATVDDVKSAFKAHLKGNTAFVVNTDTPEITLREEQQKAVDFTSNLFIGGKRSKGNQKKCLWNAIMRFGKTLTTYKLVETLTAREDEKKLSKVLIITHRPVVGSGWHEDFQKVFKEDSGWSFISKKYGESNEALKTKQKLFYFASLQDLRGSFDKDDESLQNELEDSINNEVTSQENEEINDVLTKNDDVFRTNWDLVVIDEGHEGFKTELASRVRENLKFRYELHLSGTPYNIVEDFESYEIYNWSYNDEREAYKKWEEKLKSGEKLGRNPYEDLPVLEIRTINTDKVLDTHAYINPNNTEFNFNKFLEVDLTVEHDRTNGKDGTYHPFKNRSHIVKLLELMQQNDEYGRFDEDSNEIIHERKGFPFSSGSAIKDFAHTLWILPTVQSAVAMEELLGTINGYSHIKVVNATGNNDDGKPLETLRKAIKENAQTITLSVGKLTTGTTVPEWTAVFMMSNMKSATLYMQTIFRAKSSGLMPDGRRKTKGYVFDFAPDRSIQMLSESAKSESRKTPGYELMDYNQRAEAHKAELKKIIEHLPIIAYKESRFEKQDTDEIMRQINRVFIHQTVSEGFVNSNLFLVEDFMDISEETAQKLTEFAATLEGANKSNELKNLKISSSKLTNKEREKLKEGKPKIEASEEENSVWKELQEKLKEDRENRRSLMRLLRSISSRIPLIVFARKMYIDEAITLDNLSEVVDDLSWEEFMPKKFTKEMWGTLKQFFNSEVFEGACYELQRRIAEYNKLRVFDRMTSKINLFNSFKDVDKETILTPQKVVSLQISETLGGLKLVDMENKWFTKGSDDGISNHPWDSIEDSYGRIQIDPQWVSQSEELDNFWKDSKTTVLDINSKTALYPANAGLSLFYQFAKDFKKVNGREMNEDEENWVWNDIVENQLFVNCRVPYSKRIAEALLTSCVEIKFTAVPESVIAVKNYRNDKVNSQKSLDKDIVRIDFKDDEMQAILASIKPRGRRAIVSNMTSSRVSENRMVQVNSSVIDLIELLKPIQAKKQKPLKKLKENGETSERITEVDKENILRWIFNPKTMRTLDENGRNMSELNAEKFMKIAEENNPEAISELLKTVKNELSSEKFSATLSNPPYQENLTDNTSKAKPVWPDFIYVSSSIAKVGSFINPARWQRGGAGTGLLPIKNYFFTSKRLQKFITLPDHKVFPGVGIGNICIELLNFEKEFEYPLSGIESEDGSIVYSEYTPNELIDIVLDEETEEVIVKILEAEMGPNFEKELWIGGQDNRTKRKTVQPIGDDRMDFGIVGPRMSRDREYFIEESKLDHNVDYLKVYYSPKSSTVDKLYLPLSELQDTERNKSRVSKWKVLIPKTNAHFFYRNLGPIAEPNSLCTNTWVCRSFDSKVECENFQSYLKTYFYRFLVCSRIVTHNATANVHRFVPDLAEVTNPRTGLVGYESDWTDEDLKILFEDVLTEEDWAYIEKTAIEADPAGGKK